MMAEEADKKTVTLTEGETKLFISIMKNLESDIAFNAEAVAQECGYKSAKVVKDRWSQIKKNKLGPTAAATPGKKSSTPAKKRKGGEEVKDGADEEIVGSPTPAKKARAPKVKAKVKEQAADEEELTAQEVPVVKDEEDQEAGKDGEDGEED